MKANPQDYLKVMEEEVVKRDQIDFLAQVGGVFNYLTAAALGKLEDHALAQEQSEAIRDNSVENLPELLEEFEKNALANGIEVL